MPFFRIFAPVMDEVQLRLTEDGSHTLFSMRTGECYHSSHGAVQESRHIFIDAGWSRCAGRELRVLEVGFGTGLNAYLTWLQAEREGKRVTYTALERYPVTLEVAAALNYADLLGGGRTADDFLRLHSAEWGRAVRIAPCFELLKWQADFTEVELPGCYDLIYFDAFSPERQPEMWTPERFAYLYGHAAPGAVLVTYCAKGAVRRALQAAGFVVERLPGPPGKREMLRATKQLRVEN